MTTHQLYATRFSSDVLERDQPSAQRRQARAGILNQSVGSVETVAAEPGQRRLRGTFVGKYAELMAAELKELLGAGDQIDAVPYFLPDATREWEGYYAAQESRDAGRRDPRLGEIATIDGTVSRIGSRRTHRRAVRVAPRQVTNPFGAQSDRFVYLSVGAVNPRWVSVSEGAVEPATVQFTTTTEHVDMDGYDHTEPSFSGQESYRLVYDLPYRQEDRHDVRCWDDYGRAKVQTENDGNLTVDPAWQRVYQTQHDYVGRPIIDNGHLRVEIQESNDTIVVSRYSSGSYSVVSPGSSAWRLDQWDINRIGLGRVVSRTRWFDSNQPSVTAELIAIINRGYDRIIFYTPDNASSPTPSELLARLDPYADQSNTVIDQSNDLLERDRIPDE